MADRGIKKVIVRNSQLPPITQVDEQNSGYILRYRIISEDRNRVSHWSPQYLISSEAVEPSLDPSLVNINGEMLFVNWSAYGNLYDSYDVFVNWGGPEGDEWFATVGGTFTIIPIDAGAESAQVTIQRRTDPPRIVPSMIIAKSTELTFGS